MQISLQKTYPLPLFYIFSSPIPLITFRDIKRTLTSDGVRVFARYCFLRGSISATNSAVIVWLLCGNSAVRAGNLKKHRE